MIQYAQLNQKEYPVKARKKSAPSQGYDFHMLMSADTRRTLDNLRKKEADFPSLAEMIRRLADRAK